MDRFKFYIERIPTLFRWNCFKRISSTIKDRSVFKILYFSTTLRIKRSRRDCTNHICMYTLQLSTDTKNWTFKVYIYPVTVPPHHFIHDFTFKHIRLNFGRPPASLHIYKKKNTSPITNSSCIVNSNIRNNNQ